MDTITLILTWIAIWVLVLVTARVVHCRHWRFHDRRQQQAPFSGQDRRRGNKTQPFRS